MPSDFEINSQQKTSLNWVILGLARTLQIELKMRITGGSNSSKDYSLNQEVSQTQES